MKKPFQELRREYSGKPLGRDSIDVDPFCQFRIWFDEAVEVEEDVSNGMTLTTIGEGGRPGARVVLLKDFDDRGFVFFTNYESQKGRDIAANPAVSLLFWWTRLARQVRIDGVAEPVSAAESDEYFASRPRAANLSAMASAQSQPVESRLVLEDNVKILADTWDGRDLERPQHWGGYRVVPAAIEFWQGRPDRLHDRILYQRTDSGAWTITRLSP